MTRGEHRRSKEPFATYSEAVETLGLEKSVDVTWAEWLEDPCPKGRKGASWQLRGNRVDGFLNVSFFINNRPILGLEHHKRRVEGINDQVIEAGWYHLDLYPPFIGHDEKCRIPCFLPHDSQDAEDKALMWIETGFRISFQPGQETIRVAKRR